MVALIRPSTDEIQLSNPYVQFQVPEVARLSNGDYVKVWSSVGVDPNGLGVAAQLFDHDGTAKSAPFVVNTFNSGDQTSAHVATLASGDFVVTWYGGPPVHTAAAQLFHADGTRIGGEISLGSVPFNDGTGGVAALTGGGFAAVHASAGDIVATVLDANGATVRTITADSGADDFRPTIVARPDGGFALFWTGQVAVLGDPLVGVVGQVFDPVGNPEGGPFLVNTTTEGTQSLMDAVTLANGGFVITWMDNSAAGGVRAQLFDSSGTRLGGEIIVNSLDPHAAYGGSVEALPWGGFIIGWQDASTTGVVGVPGLRAQLFDADGSRMGDEVNLNSSNHSEQGPNLAAISGSDLLAFWYDSGATGVLGGMVERHFNLPVVGTDGADTFLGTAGDDIFVARAGGDLITTDTGNDVLDGGAGADTMVGGLGNDAYVIDDAGDVVVELPDGGIDLVETSLTSFTLGATFEQLSHTGTAAAALTGNGLANTITGGAGNDTIDGLAGADSMAGGAGDDLFLVDDTNDVVSELPGGGTDTVRTSVDFTLAANVERLEFTGTGPARLIGNAAANTIIGGDSDDTIKSFGAILPSASDTLIGGAGNDTYTVSLGDTIVENPDEGIDSVNSVTSYTLPDNVENLTLIPLVFSDGTVARTDAIGNALDNHIVGSAGSNSIDGGAGQDTIEPGAGADTIRAGDGNDTIIFAGLFPDSGRWLGIVDGGNGIDTLDFRSAAPLTIKGIDPGNNSRLPGFQLGGQVYVIGGIERILLGAADDSVEIPVSFVGTLEVRGGEGADDMLGSGNSQLFGDGGNDRLRGGSGADSLDGGDGNDMVNGGGGADVLTGGNGVDVLTGGLGNDVFRDTAAGLNGDTITDFGMGDTLRITDASLGSFTFALNGSTLTYTGGSLTLQNLLVPSHLVAAAAAGGGVDLTLTMDAPSLFNNTLTGDYNGDGRDDLLWRSDAGQLSNWLGKTNGGFVGNDANAFATVDPSWKVVGAGDFNGDGRDDIVWRNANTGQVSDWLGQANGGFVGNDANAFALVDISWKIVGTGDFNGDGKDDLLWRNENTGQLSDWLGNASGNGGFSGNDANAFTQVGTDWKIVGFADFNGDGKDDLLWRNANTGALSDWLGNASGNGGFTGNDAKAFAMVDKAWHVIGTGDFNGDGREDILWRSDTGQLSNWLGKADGGFVGNDANAFRQVGLDWQVAGVGDYDGDKRDDILWRNTTTGALSDWLGQANGGFAGNDGNALVTGVSLTWQNPVFDSFAI